INGNQNIILSNVTKVSNKTGRGTFPNSLMLFDKIIRDLSLASTSRVIERIELDVDLINCLLQLIISWPNSSIVDYCGVRQFLFLSLFFLVGSNRSFRVPPPLHTNGDIQVKRFRLDFTIAGWTGRSLSVVHRCGQPNSLIDKYSYAGNLYSSFFLK